ncbi:MAG: matrixin family metalloprotease [Bdellovibrionales bacterium]
MLNRKCTVVISLLSAVLLFGSACTQLMVPQESCNFVQNAQEQRVSWKKSELITVAIHESVPDEESISAVVEALEIWEESTGYEIFEFVDVQAEEDIGNYDIRIYWNNDWEDNRQLEQARTLIKWRGNNIYSAVIGVNAEHNSFFTGTFAESGKVDLVALMVHEIGHALGLNHVHDTNSVMEPSLATGFAERRKPFLEDLESMSCEYSVSDEVIAGLQEESITESKVTGHDHAEHHDHYFE